MVFFLFFVVVVFGLARDGCLVRSWLGVAQRGGAAGLRAKRGCEDAAKPIRHNHAYARLGGGSFSR